MAGAWSAFTSNVVPAASDSATSPDKLHRAFAVSAAVVFRIVNASSTGWTVPSIVTSYVAIVKLSAS